MASFWCCHALGQDKSLISVDEKGWVMVVLAWCTALQAIKYSPTLEGRSSREKTSTPVWKTTHIRTRHRSCLTAIKQKLMLFWPVA